MSEQPTDAFDLPETLQLGPDLDPHPFLRAARQCAPITETWPLSVEPTVGVPSTGRMVWILGYDEAVAVLRNGEIYSSALVAEAMGPLLANTMVAMDGETHRAHRALVAHAFRPRLLKQWEDLVRRIVHELIDTFAPHGSVDLVRHFNFTLPVRVIARILGLPEEDAPQFRRWSIDLLNVGLDWEQAMRAFDALEVYFANQVASRRAHPKDDLITELVNAELDGDRLSDEEIFATLRLLLPAGIETTYRTIGNMMYALLTHPDQLEFVRADPRLISPTVEESLRWEGPIVQTGRVSTQDSVIAGVDIPAGTTVSVVLASANRDEGRFTDPDRFDVRRANNAHIAFGSGPHSCLGMHLARMEMRIALTALIERLPELRLDPEAAAPYVAGLPLRSPPSLPILFAPS